jgi:phosphohistidine phosphatase
MTELYVVRHGIAVEPGSPGITDSERMLTPKGRKRMRQIACGLRRLGIAPDRIVTSPLPRARETAEIVAGVLELDHRLEESESLHASREAAAIRDWLLAQADSRLMIVGHNPALSDLVGLLTTGLANPYVCELKKGGAAALSPRSGGGFVLDWVAPPRLLRLLGEAS